MEKTLESAAKELRAAAQSIMTAADILTASFGKTAESPKPVTLEQVRAVLADKSRDGRTAEVRALLEKHGAAKLSDISPDEYAGLLKDAEDL